MKHPLFLMLLILTGMPAFSQKYLLEADVNADTTVSNVGFGRKYDGSFYLGGGYLLGKALNDPPSDISHRNSYNLREGVWGRIRVNRFYSVGAFLEYSRDEYRLLTPIMGDTVGNTSTKWTRQINNNIFLGLINRFKLNNESLSIDLCGWGGLDVWPRVMTRVREPGSGYSYRKTIYNRPDFMNIWHYGMDVRLNYSSVAIYGRYRMSSVYKTGNADLPKFTLGFLIDFRD